MPSKYGKSGNSYFPTSDEALQLHDALPVGNYIVQHSMESGFFFTATAPFKLPTKLYGNTNKLAERITRTFLDRDGSTGVLLSGEKGSGKTLLAKTLSQIAADNNMPTILINNSFRGDSFNQLIQNLTQPAVVIFDEFEKVYKKEEQEQILTLLDGVFQSKKLYIFTCNERSKLDPNMVNRPGRVYYYQEYKGLDADFIREYCEDNLHDKTRTGSVLAISSAFWEFNFDMLKAIVEESNRYNEDPFDAITLLNAKPDFRGRYNYKIELTDNGEVPFQVRDTNTWDPTFSGNPLVAKEINLSYYMTEADVEAEAEERKKGREDANYEPKDLEREITISSADIVKVESNGEVVYYDDQRGHLLKLSRIYPQATGIGAVKDIAHLF